jgi:hypothetical protein
VKGWGFHFSKTEDLPVWLRFGFLHNQNQANEATEIDGV